MVFDLLKHGDSHGCGCGSNELGQLLELVNGSQDRSLVRMSGEEVPQLGPEASVTRRDGRSNVNRRVDLLNLLQAITQDPDPTPVRSVFGNRTPLDADLPVSQFSRGPASNQDVINFGITPDQTGIGQFSLRDNLRRLIQNLG